MILTYQDLHDQKQLNEVIKKYTRLFPDNCEITPAMVKVVVENWIPLATFIEDKVSQGAMAQFRIEQEEVLQEWFKALPFAMANRKPDIGYAIKRYREGMEEAYRGLMEYDVNAPLSPKDGQ